MTRAQQVWGYESSHIVWCCNCSQITLDCGCTTFGHGELSENDDWQHPCTHGSYAPCKKHQKSLSGGE